MQALSVYPTDELGTGVKSLLGLKSESPSALGIFVCFLLAINQCIFSVIVNECNRAYSLNAFITSGSDHEPLA